MEQSLNNIRHERSKKDFPKLKLEDDEYVEIAIARVAMSYMMLWCGIIAGIILIMIAYLIVLTKLPTVDETGKSAMGFFALIISIVLLILGLAETYVFNGNKMYITNKRVTQFMMISPVASSVNIIDLSSIEDVSFRQAGLIQKLFHFGTLRLSTVGDETTYTFPYTNISSAEVARIVKLVNDDREKNKN